MNHQKLRNSATAWCLTIAATLMTGNLSWSDEFSYRTAFENIAGVEELEAGDIQAGIKILEDQLDQSEKEIRGDILSTLCAAYVIDMSLVKAGHACNEAVENYGTEMGYNNRGVYRVFTGDWIGAREDFDRARPQQLEAYLEELKTMDVRLMAIDNYERINLLSAKFRPADIVDSHEMTPASIEKLTD